jgi:hypothetical protein
MRDCLLFDSSIRMVNYTDGGKPRPEWDYQRTIFIVWPSQTTI